MLRLQQRFFLSGSQDADAQRFSQEQLAAGLRGAVFLHAFGRHNTGNCQAENRLWGVNRVTTRQRDTRLFTSKTTALGHLAGNFWRQFANRPAENSDRHNRLTAHREDIADGVGRRDAAKVERVVDNRHKEIGGTDDRGTVTQVVDGSIIARFVANKQVRVDKLRLLAVQDGFQHLR